MDGEGEGEGEGLNPDSHVLPKLKQRGSRVDGGVDRISQLPNEILFLILSSLPVRNAAATTVLSSRWLGLWKQNPNLKFNLHSDRISQLPDQIILAILSLLTVRESVATSVLSSRWSDLWMLCPYLNFYGGDFDNDVNLCEVVNSVIQSHKAPSLKQFSVSFSVLESDKSAVTKWLEFVSSRPVEVLELDFTFTLYSVMVVLEESLREMSSPFLCQSLKRLSLKFLIVSGEDIELFLCNCPLLEELTIYKAPLTSDINVCGAKLMLKRLDLLGCEGAISLQVSAPNLTSFRFPHTVGKLVFENVPELVEADLVCLSPEFPVLHITCISQLQILKLNFSHFKLLYTDVLSRMPNLKKLFIHCVTVNNCSLPRLTDLIWASPCLEEFTFQVLDTVGDPSAMVEDITNVERSPHQHLKVFNFEMFSDLTDLLVELATYFSDNCAAIRRIDIGHLDEERPDRDYISQRLRGKLRSQIQMRFYVLIGRGSTAEVSNQRTERNEWKKLGMTCHKCGPRHQLFNQSAEHN